MTKENKNIGEDMKPLSPNVNQSLTEKGLLPVVTVFAYWCICDPLWEVGVLYQYDIYVIPYWFRIKSTAFGVFEPLQVRS